MPVSVSGNGATNPYLSTAWQQGSQFLQQAGLDPKYSTQIGNILNGNTDGIITGATDGMIDAAFGENTVGGAIAKGVVDIVKTVLMGQYKMGADTQEAKANLQDITDTGTSSNQIADAGASESKNILSQLDSDLSGVKVNLDSATNQLTVTLADGQQQVVQLSEDNKALAETLNKNQSEIEKKNTELQKKQARMAELKDLIANRKAELGIASGVPSPSPAGGAEGAEGKEGVPQFEAMSTDGIDDPTLQGYIEEFNSLGVEIPTLQNQITATSLENKELFESITANNTVAQETVDGSIEVADQQSAYIDEQTNNIMSMCNDAKSAIGEVQKLLQGQFPKLDQMTVVKLATSMTKAAVCGTNGGLLATAAATMGVGSIVSFGATASKAAELGAASGDQFAGSAKHIATNVAGKLIQQQMKAYMNQTFASISQMTGVDLSGMQSMMNQFIQEQASMKNDSMMAFQDVQKEVTTGNQVA